MAGSLSRCLAGLLLFLQGSAPHSLPTVEPNDNRTPRGTLAGDSLVVSLEVRMATWYPEEPGGAHAEVATFAEAGRAPAIPGPLIRVSEGVTIIATLLNALADSSVTFRGFTTRPAAGDSGIRLAPGERRTVRFLAGRAGTYFYQADVGVQSPAVEQEQLAGAFVVDPPGGSPPDRIFVINIWGESPDSTTWRNALAINGRSWPHTERISATAGDSIRWRVINPTMRPHPMHLHGVYYQMRSAGTMRVDTTFAPEMRPLVVTHSMNPGTTMSLVWRPDRPGNWLFHCHLMFHAVGDARLGTPDPHAAHSGDPEQHMAGLVLGIVAEPRPGEPTEVRKNPRRVTLEARETEPRGRARRRLGIAMVRGQSRPGDTVSVPGPLLVLTRGEPTDILVRNRLPEATAIHWHGIELESWSDGVPGWSGIGDRRAPAIAPGDSFVARLTLPRAGTFMYHTHLNDIEQLTSGMYGPIVVLEPGKQFEPEIDHVFLVSWDGSEGHRMVNGDSLPRTEPLRRGIAHRFRFLNIGPADGARFWMMRDSTLLEWTQVARDGAELPPLQQTRIGATGRVDVGEIADYEFRADEPGEYRLMQGPARGRRLLRTFIVK